MAGEFPVHANRSAEIDIGADAESTALERRVPVDGRTETMPADSHDRVPHAGCFCKPWQISERDVVVERDTTHTSRDVQVPRHSSSHLAVTVDQIQIDLEVRQVDTVAAEAGPETIALDPPCAIRYGDPAEEGAVKLAVDDPGRSTSIAAERRHVDVDANADGHPREYRIHRDAPVFFVLSGLRRTLGAHRVTHTDRENRNEPNPNRIHHRGFLKEARPTAWGFAVGGSTIVRVRLYG